VPAMTYKGLILLDGTEIPRWTAQSWLYRHARADDYRLLQEDHEHGCRIVFWDQDLEVLFRLAFLHTA
jgi:hypothetical protein